MSNDPDWSALLPRVADCGKASCNWMEFHNSRLSDMERMVRIRRGIIDSNTPLTLRPRGAFVKLNVGKCRTNLQREDRQVRFVHAPRGSNESHAHMEGLQSEDDVAAAILGDCVIANFPGVISG